MVPHHESLPLYGFTQVSAWLQAFLMGAGLEYGICKHRLVRESPTPAGSLPLVAGRGAHSQRTWRHRVFQGRVGAPTFKEAYHTGDKLPDFQDRKSL